MNLNDQIEARRGAEEHQRRVDAVMGTGRSGGYGIGSQRQVAPQRPQQYGGSPQSPGRQQGDAPPQIGSGARGVAPAQHDYGQTDQNLHHPSLDDHISHMRQQLEDMHNRFTVLRGGIRVPPQIAGHPSLRGREPGISEAQDGRTADPTAAQVLALNQRIDSFSFLVGDLRDGLDRLDRLMNSAHVRMSELELEFFGVILEAEDIDRLIGDIDPSVHQTH